MEILIFLSLGKMLNIFPFFGSFIAAQVNREGLILSPIVIAIDIPWRLAKITTTNVANLAAAYFAEANARRRGIPEIDRGINLIYKESNKTAS